MARVLLLLLLPLFVAGGVLDAQDCLRNCKSLDSCRACVKNRVLLQDAYRRCHSSVGTHQIALTFDNGNVTDEVLDTLRAHNVSAAFFVRGSQLDSDDCSARVRQAIDDGHLVLNNYADDDDSDIKDKDIRKRIQKWEKSYRKLTCRRCVRWMRPGSKNNMMDDVTAMALKQLGYRTVLWNMDSEDDDNESTDKVCGSMRRRFNSTYPDSIVLRMRDSGANCAAVLRDFIPYARSRGYSFMRLDDCVLGRQQDGKDSQEDSSYQWAQSDDGYGCLDQHDRMLGGAKCSDDKTCGNGRCVDGHCQCNDGYTCSCCSHRADSMTDKDTCPEDNSSSSNDLEPLTSAEQHSQAGGQVHTCQCRATRSIAARTAGGSSEAMGSVGSFSSVGSVGASSVGSVGASSVGSVGASSVGSAGSAAASSEVASAGSAGASSVGSAGASTGNTPVVVNVNVTVNNASVASAEASSENTAASIGSAGASSVGSGSAGASMGSAGGSAGASAGSLGASGNASASAGSAAASSETATVGSAGASSVGSVGAVSAGSAAASAEAASTGVAQAASNSNCQCSADNSGKVLCTCAMVDNNNALTWDADRCNCSLTATGVTCVCADVAAANSVASWTDFDCNICSDFDVLVNSINNPAPIASVELTQGSASVEVNNNTQTGASVEVSGSASVEVNNTQSGSASVEVNQGSASVEVNNTQTGASVEVSGSASVEVNNGTASVDIEVNNGTASVEVSGSASVEVNNNTQSGSASVEVNQGSASVEVNNTQTGASVEAQGSASVEVNQGSAGNTQSSADNGNSGSGSVGQTAIPVTVNTNVTTAAPGVNGTIVSVSVNSTEPASGSASTDLPSLNDTLPSVSDCSCTSLDADSDSSAQPSWDQATSTWTMPDCNCTASRSSVTCTCPDANSSSVVVSSFQCACSAPSQLAVPADHCDCAGLDGSRRRTVFYWNDSGNGTLNDCSCDALSSTVMSCDCADRDEPFRCACSAAAQASGSASAEAPAPAPVTPTPAPAPEPAPATNSSAPAPAPATPAPAPATPAPAPEPAPATAPVAGPASTENPPDVGSQGDSGLNTNNTDTNNNATQSVTALRSFITAETGPAASAAWSLYSLSVPALVLVIFQLMRDN